MSEQTPPVFEQWLLAQMERDDPIGDVAREIARRHSPEARGPKVGGEPP